MDRNKSNPDPTTNEPSAAPQPDRGDVTPPHGDEVVNRQRNMSRTSTPPAPDPDNDRPAE
jgi:hypothetical protein